MTMDVVISALKSGSSTEIVNKLTDFNNQHCQSMSLDADLTKKKQLAESLFRLLRDPEQSDHHALVLSSLRILTRDARSLDQLFTPDRIETILHMANLVGEEEAYMTNSSSSFDSRLIVEGQKCLCNLIFNSPIIQRLCCHNSTIDGIMLRMKMYREPSLPIEIKYFDMRMLFLLTALCPDVRSRVREEYHGLIYLMEAIDLIVKSTQDPSDKSTKKSLRKRKGSGRRSLHSKETKETKSPSNEPTEEDDHSLTDDEINLIIEVLKVLFNLTCNLDRRNADEAEEAHFMRLVAILHDLLLSETHNKERKEEVQSHTINLLTNMPSSTYEELLVPVEEIGKIGNPKYEYEDTNVEAVAVILDFLERRLSHFNLKDGSRVSNIPQQPTQPGQSPPKPLKMHESLSPVLIGLAEMARSQRIIRKYLKQQILPPLRDVKKRPEEGNTLRSQLVRLMTNPDTDVKELVADFLFVLCKESVGRLIKYTGYGNAAGLLARRGLMLGGRGNIDNYSSESEDSDTEEYLQAKDHINPVVGCYEPPRPNPMEGMTEEQKEYEAIRLVNAIDQMTRAGIVKPAQVGEDGKPHPIDHVLQLRERGMDATSRINRGEEESDD